MHAQGVVKPFLQIFLRRTPVSFGFFRGMNRRVFAHNSGENGIERMMDMDRHQLPALPCAWDAIPRTTEIRLAPRAAGHGARREREARP